MDVNMTEQKTTTVASTRAEGNVVKMRGVDLLKSMETNPQGRFYTTLHLAGEWVEFAVKAGGVVDGTTDIEEVEEVEMYDVDLLTTKRVLGNGHLIIGDRYRDTEVTVALRVVEGPHEPPAQPEAETEAEATENESVTVHS